MKNVIKAVALFIGTVVGAGLASGKEIAVYFNGLNPLTTIFSGVFLGFFCSLFMFAGKNNFLFYPKWFRFVTLICSVITLSAMCAGAESILKPVFPFGGLVFTLLSIFIAFSGMKQIKLINTVMVPAIILGIALLYFKNGETNLVGSLMPFKPVSYAALNLLIAGTLMADTGKTMTKKEIIISGLISASILSGMLFCLGCTVIGKQGEMPLYNVAANLGFGHIATALILLAIFTTMVSSAKIITDEITLKCKSKVLSYFICLSACYPLSLIGFSPLITYGYPLVSATGLVQLFMTIIKMLPKPVAFYAKKQKNLNSEQKTNHPRLSNRRNRTSRARRTLCNRNFRRDCRLRECDCSRVRSRDQSNRNRHGRFLPRRVLHRQGD